MTVIHILIGMFNSNPTLPGGVDSPVHSTAGPSK